MLGERPGHHSRTVNLVPRHPKESLPALVNAQQSSGWVLPLGSGKDQQVPDEAAV